MQFETGSSYHLGNGGEQGVLVIAVSAYSGIISPYYYVLLTRSCDKLRSHHVIVLLRGAVLFDLTLEAD